MAALKDLITDFVYDAVAHRVAHVDEDVWSEVDDLAHTLLNLVGSPRLVREAIRHIQDFQSLRLALPAPGIFLDKKGDVFGAEEVPTLGIYERYTRAEVAVEFGVTEEPEPWQRLFSGLNDDAKEILRIWIVGALLGIPTNKVLYLWGGGGSGKSTLAEALLAIFGDMAYSFSDAEKLFRHDEYYMALLRGRRLLVLTEFTKGLLGTGLKGLSGGDRLLARWPYGRPFSFTATHRILILSNEPPLHTDIPSAMDRRILALRMEPPATLDSHLPAALRETAPQWVSWLWAQYAELAELIEDRSIFQAQDASAADMSADTVTNFAAEQLIVPAALGASYTAYREYCEAQLGAKALSRNIFKSRLRALGYQVITDQNKSVTIVK